METNTQKFAEVLSKNAEGFLGMTSGWSVEDVEHEKLGAGQKGKIFALALGWESVDAHMKATKTQAFKDNIHLLGEAKTIEMHHVHMKQL